MTTLGEWFFLKTPRSSFKPHPLQDRQITFCHQEVNRDIQRAIKKATATGETLKLLLWGDWGVGKTHTLRHLDYWLEQNAQAHPAHTVYVEIGDISKDASFAAIHKDLLEGLGLQRVIELAFGYMKLGRNIVDLASIGVSQSVIGAFSKLYTAAPGSPPPEAAVLAWSYLKGDDVGRAGTTIGLPRQIEDGKEFYYVLSALGHMMKVVEKKQLIFLVDEAAKLEAIGRQSERERHWVNVNKMIFDIDNRHFGFVYTVSGKSDVELPAALFEPQIENRLGDRRIELKNLLPSDVERFLEELSEAFVDKEGAEASGQANLHGIEGYSRTAYPFSASARERFIEYFQRTQENSKPRDIADKLDDLAFDALEAGKRLIDDAVLNEAGM